MLRSSERDNTPGKDGLPKYNPRHLLRLVEFGNKIGCGGTDQQLQRCGMYSEETEHVESRYGKIEDMLEDRMPFR